jgi:predicted phage baseplate assembly protein
MPLPTPNLDDRRFQDFVDDAKRLVQQRCPEWTDHNVSDPGITLIETFAMMLDQVMYRLNRVPELHYLRFLELIGVRPFPPTAATADLTFWLASPAREPVTVAVDTEVATVRVFRGDAASWGHRVLRAVGGGRRRCRAAAVGVRGRGGRCRPDRPAVAIRGVDRSGVEPLRDRLRHDRRLQPGR